VSSDDFGDTRTLLEVRTDYAPAFPPGDLSPAASEIMRTAWSASSADAISRGWGRWVAFCTVMHWQPAEATPERVANFLAASLPRNKNRWTYFKQLRSAISTKLALLPQGVTLRNSVLLNFMMKAIMKLRPTAPKYREFFDSEVLARHFRAKPVLAELEWNALAGRLICLLYLTGLRACDIARVSLSQSHIPEDDSHKMSLVTRTKEKATGDWVVQDVAGVPAEPALCPHCCALAIVRQRPRGAPDLLLVSPRSPKKGLSSEWISKLARQQMADAGIDTKRYGAHALRGAGASKLLATGVPEAIVRRMFRWAPNSRWVDRSYNRTSDDTVFEHLFSRCGAPDDADGT